ncbi:MAG: lipopolysaccharide biosynthesis protein [Rikenellaceae bacterium]|nr:lipopolysaccharide biosynthesis protein [Rikenellaceae bacterium]
MADSILYKLRSGKPNKFWDFTTNFASLLIPNAFYRAKLNHKLQQAKQRPDYNYILERVDYYCRINSPWQVSKQDKSELSHTYLKYTGTFGNYHRKMFRTAYYFDQRDVTRYFPQNLRWNYLPGDVYFTPSEPTIVKSRMLTEDNRNSVLLKLDKLRHFMFVEDKKSFRDKQNRAIFRGKIRHSRVRTTFLERYFHHPMFDCGVVGKNEGHPMEWMAEKKTINEHLDYKFIMAIEGNDVASNLKWVMSSNSIAVMTRPTCETWFMEGKLIPDYHYIEVKDDFSDAEEKLNYYISHPDKAETIISNAHQYVKQFFDHDREELIQLMVMQRYLQTSGQI